MEADEKSLRIIWQYEQSISRPSEEALVKMGERGPVVRPGIRKSSRQLGEYASKCTDYLRFGNEVDACLDGSLSMYTDVMVRKDTPAVLRRCGFENLAILHTQYHLRRELRPKNDYKHQHGISVEQLKSLPELLENPILIFDTPDALNRSGQVSGKGKGFVSIVDTQDADGIPLTAYFSPNGCGQYETENITSNFMTSLYGRRNLDSYIERAWMQGKLLYVDSGRFAATIKGSLRFSAPQCTEAIENLNGIIQCSDFAVNEAPRLQKTLVPPAQHIRQASTPKQDMKRVHPDEQSGKPSKRPQQHMQEKEK
jgi:hypothetical protein